MRLTGSALLKCYMESSVMNEKQIKELCKYFVRNRRHPLPQIEEEMLEIAIDRASNVMELSLVAFLLRLMGK